MVGSENQAGYLDIRHKADQKQFPVRLDSYGNAQFALFKIKPMNSEWRMPVYSHQQVFKIAY